MRVRQLNSKQVQITAWPSINSFLELKELPQGYLVVRDNDVPIDLFYKSADSDTTIVCFHGAASEDVRIPWHVGSGVVRHAGANRLSVSDPTLQLFDGLNIGWFAGNHLIPDLQNKLVQLIGVIQEITETEHLIFLGGSAGGFAALAASLRFPGSLVLPMNPQTSIGRYHAEPLSRYLKHAWPAAQAISDLPEHVSHDLVSLYKEGHPNLVAVLQNRRDSFHVKNHYRPLVDVLELNQSWIFASDWGRVGDGGHIQPPRSLVAKLLTQLTLSQGQWDRALEQLDFDRPR